MKVQFTIDTTDAFVEVKVLESRMKFTTVNWRFWKDHVQQTVKPLLHNANGVRWTEEQIIDEATMRLSFEPIAAAKPVVES
jgi:hypothetical protein